MAKAERPLTVRKWSLGRQRIGHVGFGSSSELAARLLLDKFPNLTTADLQTTFAVTSLTFVRLADDLRE